MNFKEFSQAPSSIKIILIALIPQVICRLLFYADIVRMTGMTSQLLGLIAEIALLVLVFKKVSWTWMAGILYSAIFTVYSVLAYLQREELVQSTLQAVANNPEYVELPLDLVEQSIAITLNVTLISLIIFSAVFGLIWFKSKPYFQKLS